MRNMTLNKFLTILAIICIAPITFGILWYFFPSAFVEFEPSGERVEIQPLLNEGCITNTDFSLSQNLNDKLIACQADLTACYQELQAQEPITPYWEKTAETEKERIRAEILEIERKIKELEKLKVGL